MKGTVKITKGKAVKGRRKVEKDRWAVKDKTGEYGNWH